ncbi:hypothetical protein LCGC14_0903340, partial [marine sediment metagenome]
VHAVVVVDCGGGWETGPYYTKGNVYAEFLLDRGTKTPE